MYSVYCRPIPWGQVHAIAPPNGRVIAADTTQFHELMMLIELFQVTGNTLKDASFYVFILFSVFFGIWPRKSQYYGPFTSWLPPATGLYACPFQHLFNAMDILSSPLKQNQCSYNLYLTDGFMVHSVSKKVEWDRNLCFTVYSSVYIYIYDLSLKAFIEALKLWLGWLFGFALNCCEILVLDTTLRTRPDDHKYIRCLAPDSADSLSFMSTATVKYNQDIQICCIILYFGWQMYMIFKFWFCFVE